MNHAAFGEHKITNYIFHFLANNMYANEAVSCSTAAISGLCSDAVADNMQVLASSSCLKMYYSVLRRNPRNVEIHINIGKMLLSFTGGARKESFMRQELPKSRLAEELQSLLRSSLKASHQGVAACLVALTVHFIAHQKYLREQLVDAGVNFTLLEYTKPEWNAVVRSMADAALNTLGETRHKAKFILSKVFNKKIVNSEMNYFRNIVRIRNEEALRVGSKSASSSPSKVLRERTLQREQQQVDRIPLKKGLSALDIELGSWFNTVPTTDQAATTIIRAARAFLAKKGVAASREEEERRLPVLKQLAEVTTDPAVLLECLVHCAKWGRLDLGLVATRRVFVLKTGSGGKHNDGAEMAQLFNKLTTEPHILVDILTTFTSMQLVQRQVLALLQLFPFDEQQVGLMADMGTADTIALRHPANVQICTDCIKTLSYFASISPRYRSLLCEDGPLKILLHLMDKHARVDAIASSCFALVANLCKDSTDNQAKFAETKLSLQLMKYLEKHIESVDSITIVCNAVKALCADGDLSNMEQYFSRDHLTLYHGIVTKFITSKVVVRQVYFLLMMAARCTGPFADYLSRELARSDAADFLVRTLLPEEEHRRSQALFFLLLITACTYLRAAPALIPLVLKANLAGILTQYLDPFWNNEVHKSTKYCLRILHSWAKTHDSSSVVFEHSSLAEDSVGGDSNFQFGSVAFDDSVSVLTHDASDFNYNKRGSNASFNPTNTSQTNLRDSQQQIDEDYVSDFDNQISVFTTEEEAVDLPDDSSLASKLQSSEHNLQKSFALLEHAVQHMHVEPTHALLVLNQIVTILRATNMASFMQEAAAGEGQRLVREVFPATLQAALLAFPADQDVQLAGCRALQSFHCDSIAPPAVVVNFGKLLVQALERWLEDRKFCVKMMKYCVHFCGESTVIKQQLSTKQSIDIFLALMRKHVEHLSLMKLCFRLIFHLCGGSGGEEAQTQLSVGGVGDLLLTLLVAHHSNREVVSLVCKAIVSLCMNKNLANIYNFGSFPSMQKYFFVIKANSQDAHICSSVSFALLGVLSLGRDVLLEGLQTQPFALELKEVLAESDFSVAAAEVMLMLASKVICNFSDLTSGFLHVNIIADLTLYSVGHWNEATRTLAYMTIRKLEEYGALCSGQQLQAPHDEAARVLHEDWQAGEAAARGRCELLISQLTIDAPEEPQVSLSAEEAHARISRFLRACLSSPRQPRARTTSCTALREVDLTAGDQMPLSELLALIVRKARIHLAVGVVKKILVGVQGSNDKSSGMASELAADPKPLLALLGAFMSIEAVPRDGLLILRALAYSEESMAAMGELGGCSLMYAIVQRYVNSNLNMCVSALKTLAFFAKGSVRNRRALAEEQSLGLLRLMQAHQGALFFMLEAVTTLTELCTGCPENIAVLAASPLSDMAVDLLVKFKLDKECMRTVGALVKVLCGPDSSEQMIRKFAARRSLSVLFLILKENIEAEDICNLYCSILTLLLGDDLDYYLAELTASSACSDLSDILRNEAMYRHNPSLLTPVFTLMVHYVYGVPLLTLALYRTDIPVTLEVFRSLPAWAPSRKAADIILSKIKIDIKQREVNRKKTLRQAEKQKTQRKLERQTSIPTSGISDWTDVSDLFSLLRDAFELRNTDDLMLSWSRGVHSTTRRWRTTWCWPPSWSAKRPS